MNKIHEKTGSASESSKESNVVYLDDFRPNRFEEERNRTEIDAQAQLDEQKRLRDKRYLLHTEAIRWSMRLENWDKINDGLRKGWDYDLAKYVLSFYRTDIKKLRDNYRGDVNTILSLPSDMVEHLACKMSTTPEIREKCIALFKGLIKF